MFITNLKWLSDNSHDVTNQAKFLIVEWIHFIQ